MILPINITVNEWSHIAICKNNTDCYIFNNGILINTITSDIISDLIVCNIGYIPNNSLSFKGYIDEFRICNSTIWTSDFKLSNAPYDSILYDKKLGYAQNSSKFKFYSYSENTLSENNMKTQDNRGEIYIPIDRVEDAGELSSGVKLIKREDKYYLVNN